MFLSLFAFQICKNLRRRVSASQGLTPHLRKSLIPWPDERHRAPKAKGSRGSQSKHPTPLRLPMATCSQLCCLGQVQPGRPSIMVTSPPGSGLPSCPQEMQTESQGCSNQQRNPDLWLKLHTTQGPEGRAKSTGLPSVRTSSNSSLCSSLPSSRSLGSNVPPLSQVPGAGEMSDSPGQAPSSSSQGHDPAPLWETGRLG